ncbi:TonB-dependent receptor [Flavobacterium ovatum]|uniref:SusC/RagA family TonB-linked outer membrane protein n=1 Tax=Flavobacterium ovatum TaxID=1928857 RepID=UPI00344DA3D4
MMIKLKFAIIALAMICTHSVVSQTKTIQGVVTDQTQLPLPGVNVSVKGTATGVVTNYDGSFVLDKVPANARIIFSFIGFTSKEVAVDGKSTINVSLIEDTNNLEEVVVVGYGTVNKKDLTGAVTTVKFNADVANQVTSVDQLLQGKAAGVQVTQNAGSLGSGISVKIRGTNSLRGNNEPLYVIDGVIISSAGEDVIASGGVGNSGQETQNGLSGINPRDIEGIQILKDASATAIYGSRGANGVVLITTKKGKKGKVKINSFITTSVRSITKKYDVLDGVDYANYQNEIDKNNSVKPRYQINGSQVFGVAYDAANNPTVSNTPAKIYNWQDELYRQGFSTKVGTSVSGGSDNGNYYISAGFDDQQGIVANSSLKSGDLRVNLNQDLNKNLKLEARVSGFFSSTDFTESGDLIGGSESFVNNVITYNPVVTGVIQNLGQDLGSANPYSWVNDFSDFAKEKRYIGSLGLTYELPLEGLSYQIQAGGDVRTKDRRRFYGVTTYQGANANGALQISTLNAASYQINNFLRFNRTFNDKHRINATAGVTYDVRNVENSIYAVENFVTTELTIKQPFLASVITQPLQFFKSDQQIFSILGRVNYTFNDKYILTASFRRDGVSKFSEENRYGSFPSFALAWRLGDEKFIKNLNLFDDLKLRAGWGQIGNHGIGPYGTLSNYGINGSLYGTPGNGTSVPLTLNNIANPNLTWETTQQLNFGLDFATKNKRFSGSIDMYDKTTKDLLQKSPIPTSSGFGSILINRGTISNKGLELALNVAPVSTDNFQINIGGNIAFNKTKIETLGIPLKDFYIDGAAQQKSFYYGDNISRGLTFKSPANVFVEGEELGLFYGYQSNGVYQTGDTDLPVGSKPGDERIVDQNKDGKINLLDRTFIGNPNPDFVYGFDLNFKIKRLTANFQFNGVYGNQIANGNLLRLANAEGDNDNILKATYTNAWRADNPSNTYPRIGFTTDNRPAITDRIIEDGSYLRLNNVTIGYDIPVEKSKFFERLNVYIAGQNLATWTHYSGYNPEITNFLYTGLIKGVDWNGSPNARTILLGLNINF